MAATTWNPSDKAANCTLTGSNLIATAGGINSWVRTVDKQSTGSFYWEITATTNTLSSTGIGIASAAWVGTAFSGTGNCGGVTHGGLIYFNAASTGVNIGTIASGTVVCIALDVAAQRIWFRPGAAGIWNNSGTANPATGVGGITTTGLGGGTVLTYPVFFGSSTNEAATANFGNSAFAGVVPSGFTSGFNGDPVGPSSTSVRVMVLA